MYLLAKPIPRAMIALKLVVVWAATTGGGVVVSAALTGAIGLGRNPGEGIIAGLSPRQWWGASPTRPSLVEHRHEPC
ncbi:hypothetical protein [Candidatus Amarobacter glycogenicus]|uniref:hypothetical protein n=1 Tax=Candidatus Amarobacter glycogenicus TaxID=3140699 RepID=UPI002A155BD5|nr:hypothetical protein [Dehalococcoidia bacterium]